MLRAYYTLPDSYVLVPSWRRGIKVIQKGGY